MRPSSFAVVRQFATQALSNRNGSMTMITTSSGSMMIHALPDANSQLISHPLVSSGPKTLAYVQMNQQIKR